MMFRFTSEWAFFKSIANGTAMLLLALACNTAVVQAQEAGDAIEPASEEPVETETITETVTTPAVGDIETKRNTGGSAISLANASALEGFIQSDKTLSGDGTYLIQHNVKVSEGAILTIEAGATLVFDPTTSIVIEGGLVIKGEPNKFVTLTSRYKSSQGTGLMVRGRNGADIDISYARFIALQMPLNFDMDWYRANVVVYNSLFSEMNTGESNILIISPLSSLYTQADKKTSFRFENNNFVNNWGSIYIENLQDDVLDLQFNNNLITNNVVYGLDKGIPSNTPVFGYYDNDDKRFRAQLQGNSIFGNYQINAATDTIIREISVGIQGEGESFDIPNNYFRSSDPDYVSSTLDHFYQNNTLPLLKPKPVLNQPSPEVHAHIYKVYLGDEEVTNYSEIPKNLNSTNVKFRVFFNRPVTEFGETQLESVFYDTINNGIRIDAVDLNGGEWSADKKVYSFTVGDAGFLKNELGYVVIRNFQDDDGFTTPDFTIGQRKAINTYSKLYNAGVASTYFPPAEVINNPGGFVPDAQDLEVLEELSELGDLSYLGAYTSLAKTWEVGLLAGTMNYMGDLQTNLMDKDDFRWGFGAFGQYNISKWFSVRGAYQYGRVAGSDLDESELGRQVRVANYRSDIHQGSLTMHFHLLQYGISKGEKFSPSVFMGVGMFGFNPQARIFTGLDRLTGQATYLTYVDGVFERSTTENAQRGDYVWVPLKAIGTEGQTTSISDVGVDGSGNVLYNRNPPKTYKKWNISIPFGVNFDFIINKSWVISIEGSFMMTFTDYLDDVSGFYWDRGISPADVNGDGIVDGNHPHASIIEANNGGINGRLGGFMGDEVLLPAYTEVVTPQGDLVNVPTAALLANPSLAKAVQADPDNPTGYIINQGLNDANTFPSARKGDPNRDWFNFFGIKVSKVFGYKRKNRNSAQNKTFTDY